MSESSLNADTIAQQLDELLEVEFSNRDTQPASEAIARLERPTQDYALDWVARITSTNIELAYQFANRVPALLATTKRHVIEAWILHAMDQYDRFGLRIALEAMQGVDDFMERNREYTVGAVFEDVAPVLLPFVQGLSGRKL